MEPIIILGMHRSGTSIVAEILRNTGVFIGADLDENFESEFFVRLNEWVFFQSGSSWDNPGNLAYVNPGFIAQTSQNLVKQTRSVKIKNYLGSFNASLKYKSLNNLDFTWGWKDPRNAFTFDIWKKIFPGAKVLIVHRNPIDVALSLKNRETLLDKQRDTKTRTGLKKKYNEFFLKNKRLYQHSLRAGVLEEGIKLWEEYIDNINSLNFNNHQAHSLTYENLIEHPKVEIEKLIEFSGHQVDEEKLNDAIGLVKKRPAYAFVSDQKMIDLYRTIQDHPAVIKLGYQNIV